ncbi:MAG: hypothetical protein ACF8SC_12375 [Phycisphaerales bacterium JB037]
MRHAHPLLSPESGGPPSFGPDSESSIPVGGKPEPVIQPGPRLDAGSPKIRAFGQALGQKHEDTWNRTPNATGTGAIHVKSFHCKMTDEGLHHLDSQINEWLDAHPQYEVKLVTSSIGDWKGKITEPNLIVQVWV